MEAKKEFVQFALKPGVNFRGLCRRFGVSPATGYKWRNRYLAEGEAGLEERSRAPLTSPGRVDFQTEAKVVEASRRWPAWGARKLKAWLERQGHVMPAASTVHAVLRRYGLRQRQTTSTQPTQRFEHEAPNQLWQMDFKGHFKTGVGRCHPLTLLDDHSRYLLCLAACRDEKRQTVQGRLVEIFRRYGLPERMTMDNGSPWGDNPENWTALELWLMRQGIRVSHSRPHHPQTQGKLERLHATLESELLQGRYFSDMEQVERAFARWREDYNQQRPHEALGQQTPVTRYRPSPRSYNPNPPPPEYDASMSVRRVDSNGKLSFKNNSVRVGKAFIRERVGIREEKDEGIYSLWWYSTKLGCIDLKQTTSRVVKRR
jgi:transposase InsO family protein